MALYYGASNPVSLGMVLQPSAAAPAVSLLSGVAAAAAAGFKCNRLKIRAFKTPGVNNTGLVHIGVLGMNITTGVGVIESLKAGEVMEIYVYGDASNWIDPAKLFLQSVSDNDGAQVSAYVV